MPLEPWTPDLAALDLLLTVAELGSVGRAAAVHGISQPSASARLGRLERQLGVPLLVRSSRGSALTPTGEAVVAWARTVIGATNALTDGVSALRAGRRVRLGVAASLTVAEYLLPRWLLALRRRRPDLKIAVSVSNSHDVCDLVRTESAEIGFIESPGAPADLHHQQISSDRLALVVAAQHPLASRAITGIGVPDILKEPLLLREPGSGTRDTFLHALTRALGEASDLDDAVELGSTTTIIATALAGGGIGVVSARAVKAELADGQLIELRVAGLDLDRPLRALWVGPRLGEHAAELVSIARRGSSRGA